MNPAKLHELVDSVLFYAYDKNHEILVMFDDPIVRYAKWNAEDGIWRKVGRLILYNLDAPIRRSIYDYPNGLKVTERILNEL